MSRRIDIELTSDQGEAAFNWRAAGAKQPKGVVAKAILPADAKVGDTIQVEVNQTLDGIEVQSVVHGRERHEKNQSIELLPTEREFKPVVETRAPGGRGRDGDRRGGRRDRDGRGRGRDGDDRARDGQRRDGDRRDRERDGRERDGRGRDGDGRGRGGRGQNRDRGPRHAPPPEVPKRPKPQRLKPGKTHRNELLAQLPEEQRPIAELALQGMPAVRARVAEENAKAVQEGRPTMPEATVLKMAEDLLPRLRVAEWKDRADAAQRQLATLDLRDLRSVVATAADPAVARDETTREPAARLKQALHTRQEEELHLWFGDIDASLAVGRVIRALRLSAQPPKAGVPFPVDIAQRLTDSTNAALTPAESPDRWIATLEAAAFSPIHAAVKPIGSPAQVPDELAATVTRLAPALPQVAEMFGIAVDPSMPFPKPLRTDYGKQRRERSGGDKRGAGDDRNAGRADRDAKRDRPRDGKRRANADGGRSGSSDDTRAADSAPAGGEPPTKDKARPDKAAADAADASAPPTPDAAPNDGTGDTGSGDTGTGDTGSGDTGSGDTGTGDTVSGDASSEVSSISDAQPAAAPNNDTDKGADVDNETGIDTDTDIGKGTEAGTDSETTDSTTSTPIEVTEVAMNDGDGRSAVEHGEAELIADAAVLEEAEAITEAAVEVSADGGSIDDMAAIDDRTDAILESRSDEQTAAVIEANDGDEVAAATVDSPAQDQTEPGSDEA